MADEQEVINDGFTGENDPLASDNTQGQVSTEEEVPPQEEGQETLTLIEGTPYKDQASLVEGYKNIQRMATKLQQENALLQKQLEAAAKAIQQNFGKPPQEQVPQGQAFWKAMSENPVAVIQALAEKAFEKRYGQKFGSLESSLTSMQRQQRINQFISEHPGFSSDDESAMVQVFESRPHLKDLPDSLEIAYGIVQANKLRADSQRSAVNNAKSIAGLGGKKTSLPAQVKKGDEFDDVLALDKEQNELFKLGRG